MVTSDSGSSAVTGDDRLIGFSTVIMGGERERKGKQIKK